MKLLTFLLWGSTLLCYAENDAHASFQPKNETSQEHSLSEAELSSYLYLYSKTPFSLNSAEIKNFYSLSIPLGKLHQKRILFPYQQIRLKRKNNAIVNLGETWMLFNVTTKRGVKILTPTGKIKITQTSKQSIKAQVTQVFYGIQNNPWAIKVSNIPRIQIQEKQAKTQGGNIIYIHSVATFTLPYSYVITNLGQSSGLEAGMNVKFYSKGNPELKKYIARGQVIRVNGSSSSIFIQEVTPVMLAEGDFIRR